LFFKKLNTPPPFWQNEAEFTNDFKDRAAICSQEGPEDDAVRGQSRVHGSSCIPLRSLE
jgi:hypothetical protein